MQFFKKKSVKLACVSLGVAVGIAFGFNNCGNKSSFNNPYEESLLASADAGEYLLKLLDEAKRIEASLLQQGDAQAKVAAAELREFIDNVEQLISTTGDHLPVDHKSVLDQRDYLVNSMAKGRELLITIEFNGKIAELEAEDVKLHKRIDDLDLKFSTSLTQLEIDLRKEISSVNTSLLALITQIKNEFGSSFEAFKLQVEARFKSLEDRVASLEARVALIENKIGELNAMMQAMQSDLNTFKTSTLTAIANLTASLEDFKEATQAEIIKLKQLNNDLNAKLVAQQTAFDAYIKAQTKLTSLHARMCKVKTVDDDKDGLADLDANNVLKLVLVAGENECSDPDQFDSGTCCLTSNNVSCAMLFPEDDAVAEEARNQCSNILITMKNHEALIREIAESEAEQQRQINQLLIDVKNLADQVKVIQAGFDELKETVGELSEKVGSFDARLLLVEFKANRSEAVASLHERSDLNLAWIARRQLDVRSRFCNANASTAYNKSDYESARHNWMYCAERLADLKKATELVQLAKAYGEGALSLNVDNACTATINGRNAESFSIAELADKSISEAIIKNCNSGANLALTFIINVIRLQDSIGPDFRTAEYMAKKAKIGQMVYFGKLVSQAGTAAIQAFENIDPTSDKLKNTVYGKIERVFKNRYVETRLRVSGKYPMDPSAFQANVPGFNLVYSEAEIKAGATPYLARVRSQELEAFCGGECGMQVVGRNDLRKIGNRLSFPSDSQIACPVVDDTVMVRSTDGKHYAYKVSYTAAHGATEEFAGYLQYNANHRPIANSDVDAQNGLFAGCGYRVRHLIDRNGIPDANLRGRHLLRISRPFAKTHGLPQCQRFVFSCNLWEGMDGKGEWVSRNPASDSILYYLSGFAPSKIDVECKKSGATWDAVEGELLKDQTDRIGVYKRSIDAGTHQLRNSISSATTQLTKDYWMIQDVDVAYGVGNDKITQAKPFYAGVGSTSEQFIRSVSRMSDYGPIKVQRCYDDGK